MPIEEAGVQEGLLARTQQEIRQRLERFLEGTPYRFNPDASTVEVIIRGLALRKLKTGYEYCPCRVPIGKEEEDVKIICPCQYHEEEIALSGICYCGLFVGPGYVPEE